MLLTNKMFYTLEHLEQGSIRLIQIRSCQSRSFMSYWYVVLPYHRIFLYLSPLFPHLSDAFFLPYLFPSFLFSYLHSFFNRSFLHFILFSFLPSFLPFLFLRVIDIITTAACLPACRCGGCGQHALRHEGIHPRISQPGT